ncbi:MAG: sulfatase-like hydrolase/transferase [Candidatus Latescibacteria bacterium]|nr:sulfatase-like hydrolase/transferase [Candidatus Latescibacterota bacterium]
MSAKRPNILYIMTDDHGTGGLSCYGSKINTTPNLDRIAQGGMRLDNCYVTYSLCSPSRATILTGKYAHVNGQTSIGGHIFDGSQPTFPKLLQESGYQTAMIGKWHLHSMPTGFDHYSVMWNQGRYFDPDFIEESECGPVWKKTKGYSTDIVVDKCLDWLTGREADKPFMLLCHFKSPHYNWEPDDKHKDMYKDEVIPQPETFNHQYDENGPTEDLQVKLETVHEQWKITHWDPMPQGLSMQEQKERNFQLFIKDYLRCVASVDDNVGRLLDYLDAEGLADDTVVVYTSDNGMFQGEHGWVDKKMMYEESLRVPFLVRYPQAIEAATHSTELVTNCDYAPTILDYAGVDIPEDIQGKSLVPVFGGETPDDWRGAFYYQHWDTGPNGQLANCGVRTKDHKLIWYHHNCDHYQLFDVNNDPLEINDIHGDPAYAEIAADMKALLAQERANVGLTDALEARIFNGEGGAEARREMQAIPQRVTENTQRLAQNTGQ